MDCISIAIVFTLSVIFGTAQGQFPVSYKELKELGVDCPYSSCNNSAFVYSDNLKYRYCNCKAECAEYDTCCVDSPFVNLNRPIKRTTYRGTCKTLEKTSVITYVVSQCNPKWRDLSIKKQCEQPDFNHMEDPLTLTPCTNIKSKITYSNYFCALCNEDDEENFLKYWKIAVWIPLDKIRKNFMENIIYDSKTNNWYLVTVQNGKNEYDLIYLTFQEPPGINFTECVPELISNCHSSWTDNVVRYKCEAYMSALSAQKQLENGRIVTQTYRNVHCAICNFATYEKGKTCYQLQFPPSIIQHYCPQCLFPVLLDVNFSDGEKVGEVNRCQKGQIFDSFYRKCRTLQCVLPGYVMSRNKCVRL